MIKNTTDLTSTIYKDALSIRKAVFIEEQHVPFSLEVDEHESDAIHFVFYAENKLPIGTIRILPLTSEKVKFQRMAVRSNYRKTGIGSKLISEAESFVKSKGFSQITLGAQLSAEAFYHELGYVQKGSIFKDAGIDHVTMEKIL